MTANDKTQFVGMLLRSAPKRANHSHAWESVTVKFLLPGLAENVKVEKQSLGSGAQQARFQYFITGGKPLATIYFGWMEGANAQGWLSRKKGRGQVLGWAMCLKGRGEDCAKRASEIIRDSETLGHGSAMTLDRGASLLADPRGFACYGDNVKLPDADQFMRFALLFGLAHAYRQVMLKWIGGMGEVLANMDAKQVNPAEAYQALADLREKVAMFDARCYFSNPVSPDRHELFTVMECFMDRLQVHSLHEEMAQQLRDVSSLAQQKLESMQQMAAEQQQKNSERLNFRLAFLGVALAMLDLLSHSPEEWMHVLRAWSRLLAGGG